MEFLFERLERKKKKFIVFLLVVRHLQQQQVAFPVAVVRRPCLQ
jgi:hypothetical protein